MTTTATITNTSHRMMPWDVMGRDLDVADGSVADVLAASGLDYTVRTLEVAAFERPDADTPIPLANFTEAPHLKAIARPHPKTGQTMILNVASQGYQIIQNDEAFAVADDMRDLGAQIVGAADFRSGGSSLLAVKLPETITVTTPGGRDASELFLLIRNSHDGSSSISYTLTTMRLACTNALPTMRGDKVASRWSVRHSRNASDRLLDVRQTLRDSVGYAEYFQAHAQKLADTAMTDAQFRSIVADLLPIASDATERVRDNREQARAELVNLYRTSPTLDGVRGSAWGGYNALTEHLDHFRTVRGARTDSERSTARAEGALYGTAANRKKQIWETFAALAN